MEAEAALFGDARGIGIEGFDKTPNLFLDLSFHVSELPNAGHGNRQWLDLGVHFPPHLIPRRNLAWASKEAATHPAFINTYATGKFPLWGEGAQYSGWLI